MPTRGALDLAAGGLAPELPGDLAHLGDGLGRDGLAEAGQPAARVHRDAPAERRCRRRAAAARPRPACTGRCPRTSRARGRSTGRTPRPARGPRGRCRPPRRRRAAIDALNGRSGGRGDRGRVGGEVRHLDDGVRIGRRDRRDRRAPAPGRWCGARAKSMLASTTAAPPSDVAQISSRRSGSATIGEAEHLLDGDLLAVPGVRVGQAVAGVLDLDLRRSPRRWRRTGPCGGGRRARSRSGWWRRAGGSAASRDRRAGRRRWGRGSPWGGVGADHEGDVAQAGEDAGAGGLEGGRRPRRRRRSTTPRGRRSSRAPGRRSPRRRSRGSRCAWCRRRRRTGRRSTRGRRRRSASWAAATPYSTKLRPHLPHGCMPTPRRPRRSGVAASRCGRPLPDRCSSCSSSSKRVSTTSSHLVADLQLVDADAGDDLAQHDQPLGARARRRRWRTARARRRARRTAAGGW